MNVPEGMQTGPQRIHSESCTLLTGSAIFSGCFTSLSFRLLTYNMGIKARLQPISNCL